MAENLKLMALDADDLAVISAHAQDAVIKSADIEFRGCDGILILPMRRFAWEAPSARRWFSKKFERRLSALHFDRITAMRSKGIDRTNPEQVLAMLAITFTKHGDDAPAGIIDITFAGEAVLQLDVECIEAQLTDLGAAWATTAQPRHGG